MAERNEARRLLCGHDAGDACDGERVAFRYVAFENPHQRRLIGAKARACDGAPVGHAFRTDVDHAGAALFIEMSQLGLGLHALRVLLISTRSWRPPAVCNAGPDRNSTTTLTPSRRRDDEKTRR